MGFHAGAFATVWDATVGKGGNFTKVRLSTSKKDKQTGNYEQDFSGFCSFVGKAHSAAKNLKEKDRIKILECDVTSRYDKEKGKEYINYAVFNFEMSDKPNGGGTRQAAEPDEPVEDDLPF